MNPTRRDVLKRSAGIVAGASITTLPLTTAAQPTGLASLVDPSLDEMSEPVMLFGTMAGFHWKDWTQERRRHFLAVVDHEFPDLAADVVDYCQRVDAA